MIPDWLHALAILSLIAGLICAVWISIDEMRHPQHMWIMNLVWPITALYASVLGLIFYFAYGRLATLKKMQAANEAGKTPPSVGLTPFPIIVAKGALHCGSGCTLGDIIAEWLVFFIPAVAIWFGYKTIFSEKMFAVWVLDFLFAFVLGIAFQYFTIAPMRNLSVGEGLEGRREGGHSVAHGLAGRHVRIHGDGAVLFVPAPSRDDARGADAGILVHDADRDACRLCHLLSGQLVAHPERHQGEDVDTGRLAVSLFCFGIEILEPTKTYEGQQGQANGDPHDPPGRQSASDPDRCRDPHGRRGRQTPDRFGLAVAQDHSGANKADAPHDALDETLHDAAQRMLKH